MIYSLLRDSIIDADVDNDQMPDAWERAVGLNPLVDDADLDTDGDGYNLQEYALAEPKIADSDGDGLSDGVEVSEHNSNPLKTDSDGDGYSDGEEVSAGYVPTQAGNYPGWQADISPYTSLAFSMNDWSGWVQTEGLNSFALVGQPYQAGIANGTTGQLRSGFVSLVEPAAGSAPPEIRMGMDCLMYGNPFTDLTLLVDSSSDLDGDGLNALEEFQQGTHPNLADTDGDGLSDREETENYDTDPTFGYRWGWL